MNVNDVNINDEETYVNPYTKEKEAVCVCGHRIGKHRYDYNLIEFDGCQVCNHCPSTERFFERGK